MLSILPKISFGISLLFVTSVNLLAAPVVGSGSWQSWAASSLDERGRAFWDNTSYDGSKMNVGYCLTGSGHCRMEQEAGAIPYYADTAGKAVKNFYLSANGSTIDASSLLQLTLDPSLNAFGWYDVERPAGLHYLFEGVGHQDTVFTPSAFFGLFFEHAGEVYYTQSSLNVSGNREEQHFAVFQNLAAHTLYFGIDDLSNLDYDYNDMIVAMKMTQAPEPQSVGLIAFCLGLGALIAIRRDPDVRKVGRLRAAPIRREKTSR